MPDRKLTRDLANEIREKYAAGNTSTYKLAVEYGTSRQNIVHIIHNRRWKD